MDRQRGSSNTRRSSRNALDSSLLFGNRSSGSNIGTSGSDVTALGSSMSPQPAGLMQTADGMRMSPANAGPSRGIRTPLPHQRIPGQDRMPYATEMPNESITTSARSRSAKKPPLTSILDDSCNIQRHSGFRMDNRQPSNSAGSVELLQSPAGEFCSAGLSGAPIASFTSPVATAGADAATSAIKSDAKGNNRSPQFALEPYVPAMDRIEAAWSMWIIVYGFYPSSYNKDTVLQRFMQFGDIDDHVTSSGNWMFIKYMTPIQAERAVISQHGTYLNGETLISVQVMEPRIAKKMNLQLARDGTLLIGNDSAADVHGFGDDQPLHALRRRTRAGAEAMTISSRYRVPDDDDEDTSGAGHILSDDKVKSVRGDDLYLKPYRRKNICERIVEYFFAY